jgi:hypothetical protein
MYMGISRAALHEKLTIKSEGLTLEEVRVFCRSLRSGIVEDFQTFKPGNVQNIRRQHSHRCDISEVALCIHAR